MIDRALSESMSHTKIFVTCLCLMGLASPGVVLGQSQPVGGRLPAFVAKASDGRTYSAANLAATGKPTVLYFISHACPINAKAVKYYNALAAAYKGKVNFIGVIDTTLAGHAKWKKKSLSTFPVILDSKRELIYKLKIDRSPWTIYLDSKGKVVDEFPGYSVPDLTEQNELLARLAKTKVVPIDTTGAPKTTVYGCAF